MYVPRAKGRSHGYRPCEVFRHCWVGRADDSEQSRGRLRFGQYEWRMAFRATGGCESGFPDSFQEGNAAGADSATDACGGKVADSIDESVGIAFEVGQSERKPGAVADDCNAVRQSYTDFVGTGWHDSADHHRRQLSSDHS
jgi:hypothetical protein